MRSRRVKEKTGARFVRYTPGSFVDPIYKEKEIWELSKNDWELYKKEEHFSS